MTQDKSSSHSEQDLVTRVRREAEQVPPEVSARLRAIRSDAIAATQAPADGWRRWPLAGVAAAAMLMLAVAINYRGPEELPALPVVDPQELALVENMELLESLEFLAWLEEGGPNAG